MPDDVQTVIALIQGGIRDEDLEECGSFIQAIRKDVNFFVDMFKAVENWDILKSFMAFWIV